jgi:hypothetical protein
MSVDALILRRAVGEHWHRLARCGTLPVIDLD